MRLLDRYLLRELLLPLTYCLSGFLIFWVAFELFRELGDLQEHKMRTLDILEYYLVRSPEILVVILPMALLLALLYTLTNHARHQEITAIRAAGVSLWRLCLPYLLVGLFASGLLFGLNEFCVPASTDLAEQLKYRRDPRSAGALAVNQIRNLGVPNDADGRRWQIGTYYPQTTEMLNPQVFWTRPDGSRIWLFADRAIRTNDVWMFYAVRQFYETGSSNTLLVPILQTNELAMPEFSETPEQIKSEINLANSSLRAKPADTPIKQILDYLRLHPKPKRSERSWLYTNLHGRLAAPWTCLVVVLIAVPFGAASGRRNVFVGVASSILICFTFFVVQQVGLALGTGGYLPSWLAAWFPNLAFALAGAWMTAAVR